MLGLLLMSKNSLTTPEVQSDLPLLIKRRWKSISSVSVITAVIIAIALWRGGASDRSAASVSVPAARGQAVEGQAANSEGTDIGTKPVPLWNGDQLVGKWRLDQSIQREIEIHPDGTAVMECKLDTFSSFIYGSKLVLHLKWSLDNDVLTHTVTSGEPKENVDRLLNAFGNERSYQVVKIDSENLILQGPSDSKKLENWVAIKP